MKFGTQCKIHTCFFSHSSTQFDFHLLSRFPQEYRWMASTLLQNCKVRSWWTSDLTCKAMTRDVSIYLGCPISLTETLFFTPNMCGKRPAYRSGCQRDGALRRFNTPPCSSSGEGGPAGPPWPDVRVDVRVAGYDSVQEWYAPARTLAGYMCTTFIHDWQPSCDNNC